MTMLTDQIKAASNDGARAKCRQAIITAAIAVAGEDPSSKPELDAARLRLAAAVLHDPNKWAGLFIYSIVTDNRLKSNSSDDTWVQIAADLWNAYAGANPKLP